MKRVFVQEVEQYDWLDPDEAINLATGTRVELSAAGPVVTLVITREGELVPAILVEGVAAPLPINKIGALVAALQSVEAVLGDLAAPQPQDELDVGLFAQALRDAMKRALS